LAGCERRAEPPLPAVEPVQAATAPKEVGGAPMGMTIQSSVFEPGGKIPAKFTADGQDVSPALSWSGLPEGTKELVLICDDPDAPGSEPWVHWIIYKLPGDGTGLPENVPTTEKPSAPAGAVQGKNSWGRIGYGGPDPPRGLHHYHFKLYALDAPLDLGAGADKKRLLAAMKGHVLAEAEVVGTYER
jgi:Raf kinase inhibitor-like YbhB/YbcL family protein